MKIPQVACEVRKIAALIEDDFPDESKELLKLADEMRRRPPRTIARITSSPISEDLKQEIRDFKKANPGLSQQKIGEIFNVNHGRVSEAINGKRR